MHRLARGLRLQRSRRMAGWKGRVYILTLNLCAWAGEVFGYSGKIQRSKELKIHGLHGKEQDERAANVRVILLATAEKARRFSTRKQSKRQNSRDTFSQCLRVVSSFTEMASAVIVPLFHFLTLPDWRLTRRQEGRRSNVRGLPML